MRVMIVGAGGYIGKKLAAALSADRVPVVALSSANGTGIDPRTGLLPEDFAVPPDVDTVYYVAQSPFHRQGAERAAHVMAVNALTPVRVAAAARRAGVRKFVYTSTGNVYAPSFEPLSEEAPLRRDNWYALSKIHAEESLRLLGDMEMTIVRLFGVYGGHQTHRLVPNLIDAIAAGRPISLEPRPNDSANPQGTRISLCYIDDVVSVLRALADRHYSAVVNVAGNETFGIRDLASLIGRRLGIEPRFTVAQRARDADLIADISKLTHALRPSFTRFEDGLDRLLSAGLRSAS